MVACRRTLLDKHTLCYCCFSLAGCWQSHADINAAGLVIGAQAVEGKRLWNEKINEGNPIVPYLRENPSSPKSLTYTQIQTHSLGLTSRGSVPHVKAHRAPSLGRIQQSDLIPCRKTLTDNTFSHIIEKKPRDLRETKCMWWVPC